METQSKPTRDRIGAALMIVLGAVVIWEGRSYQMGTLTRMGAGYVPVVLGALLVLVGVLIALTSRRPVRGDAIVSGVEQPSSSGASAASSIKAPPKHGEWSGFQWRGWGCILAGVAAFVILGRWGGLVPATFAAVFVSALGDRENRVRDALLLALGITIAGVLIFNVGLKLVFPLFTWG